MLKNNSETLKRFLTDGIIEPLDFNAGVDVVHGLLGEPYAVFRPNREIQPTDDNIVELYYSNLRLTFVDDELKLISVVFGEDLGRLPEQLDASWYDTVSQMDVHAFRHYLVRSSIQCQRVMNTEPDILLCLRQTRMQVAFLAEHNYRIQKILSSNGVALNLPLENC
jgi:hypothetical protein